MSEINWKDAPEWAEYAAMDSNGDWFWYKDEPVASVDYWKTGRNNMCEPIMITNDGWEHTLQKRPKP